MPCIVAHIFNSRNQKIEAGGSLWVQRTSWSTYWVSGQQGLLRVRPCLKNKPKQTVIFLCKYTICTFISENTQHVFQNLTLFAYQLCSKIVNWDAHLAKHVSFFWSYKTCKVWSVPSVVPYPAYFISKWSRSTLSFAERCFGFHRPYEIVFQRTLMQANLKASFASY